MTRGWLRARVFVRVVLPLLEVVVERRPEVAEGLGRLDGRLAIRGPGPDLDACLRFARGRLAVERWDGRADVSCRFRDLASMNAFFAGRPALPEVTPLLGLASPVLLAKTARLLATLRVLAPKSAAEIARETAAERSLRVRLVLYLVTAAISRLHQDGFAPARDLVEGSPDRVYQWTVGSSDIAAYLRVRDGRVRAGRGVYPHRAPFVGFAFRDVEAAHRVLSAEGSQMSGFKERLVTTSGSPEYTRKVSLLMQKVDELMQEA